MENKRILFGICGSFCNHAAVLEQLTARLSSVKMYIRAPPVFSIRTYSWEK